MRFHNLLVGGGTLIGPNGPIPPIHPHTRDMLVKATGELCH